MAINSRRIGSRRIGASINRRIRPSTSHSLSRRRAQSGRRPKRKLTLLPLTRQSKLLGRCSRISRSRRSTRHQSPRRSSRRIHRLPHTLQLRPQPRILPPAFLIALAQIMQLRLALQFPHMLVKSRSQIPGRLAKLRHHATQSPRQFRQFLRPEDHQGHQKYDYEVRNTEHRGCISAFQCIIE